MYMGSRCTVTTVTMVHIIVTAPEHADQTCMLEGNVTATS